MQLAFLGETWQDAIVSPRGVLDRCSCNRVLSMVRAGLRSAGRTAWLGCPVKVSLIGPLRLRKHGDHSPGAEEREFDTTATFSVQGGRPERAVRMNV